jgi:hypothetical protein
MKERKRIRMMNQGTHRNSATVHGQAEDEEI